MTKHLFDKFGLILYDISVKQSLEEGVIGSS